MVEEAIKGDHDWSNDADNELPDIPECMRPWGYRLLVMPISMPKKVGSVYLSVNSGKYFDWENCYGRVVAVGSAYGKNPRFDKLGISPDDFPKVGQYLMFPPQSKMRGRVKFFDTNLILMNDEHILMNLGDKMPNGLLWFDEGSIGQKMANIGASSAADKKPKLGELTG